MKTMTHLERGAIVMSLFLIFGNLARGVFPSEPTFTYANEAYVLSLLILGTFAFMEFYWGIEEYVTVDNDELLDEPSDTQ